jgi:hypothetical protein
MRGYRGTPALLATVVSLLLAQTASATASDADADASLGAWRDYAVQGITPDFDWVERSAAVEPTVLDRAEARTALLPALEFAGDAPNGVSVALSHSVAGDTPGYESGGLAARSLTRLGTGIERTFVAPSLTRTVGDSTIRGSLILAQQQFATMGFGATTLTESPSSNPLLDESSVGTGVRIEVRQPLNAVLGFTAAYQSKLDMQAFQSYRGLFSDPGDFDIPAVASAELEWALGRRASLGFGVQRVMYSDVSAFTSAALPRRLLALLGDGTSPTFAWRDLTVYSVDWTWRPTRRDEIELRYTTQQQPEPTSRLLYNALADQFTDNNLALALTHRFVRAGSLRFAASYAPTQYFLGNASYLDPDASGDQVEVEAVWRIDF